MPTSELRASILEPREPPHQHPSIPSLPLDSSPHSPVPYQTSELSTKPLTYTQPPK